MSLIEKEKNPLGDDHGRTARGLAPEASEL
jgi:hypothetical protein